MKKTYGRGILTAAAAACLAACFALSAGAEEGSRWDYTTGKDSQGNVTIQFSEVSLTLPASWAGNCAMSIGGDSVNFFHIDSRDLWTQELGYSNGGSLFTLCYTQTLDYLDLPSYETLGNGEDGIYYVALPTDVQGYYENEEVMAEFTSMSNDVSWVLDHILINGVPASGIAAEAAGSDALIYGVDGSPDVKALVAEGGITGTGAQSPINIGKTIAEVYYQWLAGEEVEERYPIETFMINADNVAEYGTDGWQ